MHKSVQSISKSTGPPTLLFGGGGQGRDRDVYMDVLHARRYVPTKYAPKLSGVQLALKAIQDEAVYDLLSKLMRNIVSAQRPHRLTGGQVRCLQRAGSRFLTWSL